MTDSKIELDEMITVGALADKLLIPVSSLITELMKNGVFATVNEKIDFDTAEIIVQELHLEVELIRKVKASEELELKKKHKTKSNSKDAIVRPPVVAVMGHVDHGKTSILDAIRTSKVAAGESGGITQHISAYQVEHNGRLITFLDTPGHEAFASIRQHGALLTDIVIIVVAADDGVKPQTIEAIRYAKNAESKIIVAINKIDKEGADINRVKQELSEQGLMPEEWGGDTVICEVSAKNKTGIDQLLDIILLVSDIEELKADVDIPARGLVIESHLETGKGPVAKLLVESGKLQTGDYLVAGSSYGKVKSLENSDKLKISTATPSTPVEVTGFKVLPEFGDLFEVVENEKIARDKSAKNLLSQNDTNSKMNISSNELIRIINRNNEVNEFNVLIKADVKGSLSSVMSSLKALDTKEVAVRFVGSGVGPVVENDILLASSSKAVIYGFNNTISPSGKKLAQRNKVDIRIYNVIYELIDDVKKELSKRLLPEIVENDLGKLIIKGIFNTTKNEIICGGEVTVGKITTPSLVRIKRAKELIAEAEITNLKKGPADVKEVPSGEMCGLSLKTNSRIDLNEGDVLEVFDRQTITRKI